MLIGVPADGLAIEWDELNQVDASKPPVFGRSTEEDLMWKLPSPPRTQGTQDLSCKEVFCSTGGFLWITFAVISVSLLIVQCFVPDKNDVLKSVTTFILSSIFYFAISFCVGRLKGSPDCLRHQT
jgi:hypothetical protein